MNQKKNIEKETRKWVFYSYYSYVDLIQNLRYSIVSSFRDRLRKASKQWRVEEEKEVQKTAHLNVQIRIQMNEKVQRILQLHLHPFDSVRKMCDIKEEMQNLLRIPRLNQIVLESSIYCERVVNESWNDS